MNQLFYLSELVILYFQNIASLKNSSIWTLTTFGILNNCRILAIVLTHKSPRNNYINIKKILTQQIHIVALF